MKRTVSIIAALLMTGAAHADTKVINGCDVILIPNTNAYYRADAKCPVGYVSQGNGSIPARSAKPADPVDVADPADVVDPIDTPDDETPVDDGGDDPVIDTPDPVDPPADPVAPGCSNNGGCDPKPGYGHGDDNHEHSGPPGKSK